MDDLCDMMDEPEIDALERESDYDDYLDDTFFERTMDAQSFGMALGLAEMISEENRDSADPADLFEDFQDSQEKVDPRKRFQKGTKPLPAFEQYVNEKCGIS